jgi:hypothetical protein
MLWSLAPSLSVRLLRFQRGTGRGTRFLTVSVAPRVDGKTELNATCRHRRPPPCTPQELTFSRKNSGCGRLKALLGMKTTENGLGHDAVFSRKLMACRLYHRQR